MTWCVRAELVPPPGATDGAAQVMDKEEVKRFMIEFVTFFCTLVQNTLDAEHKALVQCG